jgi:cytochrome o ubiquinol oxidase subunit IV
MSISKNTGIETGNVKTVTYITGLILAIVLTVISFSMIFIDGIPRKLAMSGIIISAILQMLVHLHYFLHLDRSSANRWNLLTLAFTALLLFIFIGGTIWIMFTLNSRMM